MNGRPERLLPWQLSHLGIAGAFALLLFAIATLRPAGEERLRFFFLDRPLPPSCAVVRETGRPCPSCGLLRGIAAVARLDLEQADRRHPASVPLALMIAAQVALRPLLALLRVRGRRALLLGAVDFATHAFAVSLFLLRSPVA